MSPAELALGAALNLALAAAALARRSLTPVGALAGVAVGAGIWIAGGLAAWSLLALFFVSSTLLSRVGRDAKEETQALTGKGARRDALQVLANGGPALLSALAWLATREPVFRVGMAAALAAANADTWASEIGLLSSRQPVSIMGFRPVPRGRSGGVTLLGLVASLAGAALIGAAYGLSCRLASWCLLPAASGALLVWGCGFLGSVVDSLLGATVQARYRDAATAQYSERRLGPSGEANALAGGLRIMTNDGVNFASGLAVAALAPLLAALVG